MIKILKYKSVCPDINRAYAVSWFLQQNKWLRKKFRGRKGRANLRPTTRTSN